MSRMARKQLKKNNKKTILLVITFLIFAASVLALLSIKSINPIVTVEAGTEFPDIKKFLNYNSKKAYFVDNVEEIDMTTPAVHELTIGIGNKTYSSKLHVVDTCPPKAYISNRSIISGSNIEASDFVDLAFDVTELDIYYKAEPDFTKAGSQDITIVLEDTSGNKSEYTAKLEIIPDTEPPTIQGVHDQTVYIGDTISYRQGIIVRDNRDENVELKIDSSAVNLRKEGSYQVIYTAVDSSGNEAVEIATINVMEKPASLLAEEKLYELVDQVLEKIIKDDMTDLEKLWAIYKWTRNHIYFTGDSDKTDWVAEATRGIQKASGDCFTYYATSHALLSRAGFEDIKVNRARDNSYHSWNLVKYNDQWYHFDATPTSRSYYYVCFMRTDAEVEEYSKWRIDYYYFDKSKYPSSAVEPIEHERNVYR